MILALLLPAITDVAPQTRNPAPIEAMEACRRVSADGERLACYDRIMASFSEARNRGELIVLDRDEVVKERRRQFGLVNDEARATGIAPITEIETEVREVQPAPTYGRTHFAFANGQVWESVGPARRPPRKGDKVKLVTGNLGAFYLESDGPRFQVKRVR